MIVQFMNSDNITDLNNIPKLCIKNIYMCIFNGSRTLGKQYVIVFKITISQNYISRDNAEHE